MVVNSTFKIAPWADALFAIDVDWWKTYLPEIQRDFQGVRYSCNTLLTSARVICVKQARDYTNSGAAAIAAAIESGASRIILLGYDCQRTYGKNHWHSDHPSNLGNASHIDKWFDGFDRVARRGKDIEILNASRETALTCFKRVRLEDIL